MQVPNGVGYFPVFVHFCLVHYCAGCFMPTAVAILIACIQLHTMCHDLQLAPTLRISSCLNATTSYGQQPCCGGTRQRRQKMCHGSYPADEDVTVVAYTDLESVITTMSFGTATIMNKKKKKKKKRSHSICFVAANITGVKPKLPDTAHACLQSWPAYLLKVT